LSPPANGINQHKKRRRFIVRANAHRVIKIRPIELISSIAPSLKIESCCARRGPATRRFSCVRRFSRANASRFSALQLRRRCHLFSLSSCAFNLDSRIENDQNNCSPLPPPQVIAERVGGASFHL
jgi:hypothetical protein